MALVGLVGIAAAGSSCSLATEAFALMCSGGSIADGTTCMPRCQREYAPTATTLTCASGVLSPTDFDCIPKPQTMFPWRAGKCVWPMPVVAGTASAAGAPLYALTASGASDAGELKIGPMRTAGRFQQIQLSFDFRVATGGGSAGNGDGIWAVITTAAPDQLGATGAAIDGTGVIGVEIDMFKDTTGGINDPDAPHVAVFYNSEIHGVTALANLWDDDIVVTPSASVYTGVAVLLTPMQTSAAILVRVWYDGMLFNRDVIAAAPSDVQMLLSMPKRIWASVAAFSIDATMFSAVTVRNFMVCGAEAPTTWSRWNRAPGSQLRSCEVTMSFGNPDPAHPGVWRPMACPAGAPTVPLVPRQTPSTV